MPYQVSPKHEAHALQEPFRKELERLHEQYILGPLRVDETATGHYNSFVLVPKPNGTVCLCLDPKRINQALIRPVHSGPTISDILLKLTNTYYMTLIDVCSCYHKNFMKSHLT